jgi:hypothetical protein
MHSARDSVIALRGDYRNQKNRLLWHLADSLMSVSSISTLDSLLAADTDRYSREARVGLALQTENFTRAQQLLGAYPTSTQEDIDFEFIQSINVDYLTLGDYPSSSDSSDLMDLAMGSQTQSGYAKTLAGVLYGFAFDIDVPDPPAEPESFQIIPIDQVVSTQSDEIYTLFPNPTSETVSLIANRLPVRGNVELRILSIDGICMHIFPIVETTSELDVVSLAPGFYIVTITTDGVLNHRMRLIKTAY